jgi:hypothetical protein
MKDLDTHLEMMEQASREYCAMIQPSGRDDVVKEIWTKITGESYRGVFEHDAN